MGGKGHAAVTLPNGDPFPRETLKPGDDREIVWFDIDNTLYPKSIKINELMQDKIRAYFVKIGLSEEEANTLHNRYYTEYGLAVRGLCRHHAVDPLDYNKHCDDALPLETVLHPNPKLRKLIRDLDPSKVRVWAVTNAYKTHAGRVLKLLNIDDLFEGIVSCDYRNENFRCKPEIEFFEDAEAAPHVPGFSLPPERNRFVDDSLLNIRGSISFGWSRRNCVLLDEDGEARARAKPEEEIVIVDDLEELRTHWRDVFKSD